MLDESLSVAARCELILLQLQSVLLSKINDDDDEYKFICNVFIIKTKRGVFK